MGGDRLANHKLVDILLDANLHLRELFGLVDVLNNKSIAEDVLNSPGLKRLIVAAEPGSGKSLISHELQKFLTLAGREIYAVKYDEHYDQVAPGIRHPSKAKRNKIIDNMMLEGESYLAEHPDALIIYEMPVWGKKTSERGQKAIRRFSRLNKDPNKPETKVIALIRDERGKKIQGEAIAIRQAAAKSNSYGDFKSTLRNAGIHVVAPFHAAYVTFAQGWQFAQTIFAKSADEKDIEQIASEVDTEILEYRDDRIRYLTFQNYLDFINFPNSFKDMFLKFGGELYKMRSRAAFSIIKLEEMGMARSDIYVAVNPYLETSPTTPRELALPQVPMVEN